MSFSFGGLIIKNADAISNKKIIGLVEPGFRFQKKINVQDAVSRDFRSIGLLRRDGVVFLFGKTISDSLAFSPGQVSLLDDSLKKLSDGRTILGFLLDGTSDSYAYSIFQNGERIRVKTYSDGQLLLEQGEPSSVEENTKMDETGLLELIKKFGGQSITELIEDSDEVVDVFDRW